MGQPIGTRDRSRRHGDREHGGAQPPLQRGIDAGLKVDDYVYEADELVTGKNTIFVATGVTNGELVAGVRRDGDFVYTESVVLRGASGTLRRISSEHLTSKWL